MNNPSSDEQLRRELNAPVIRLGICSWCRRDKPLLDGGICRECDTSLASETWDDGDKAYDLWKEDGKQDLTSTG